MRNPFDADAMDRLRSKVRSVTREKPENWDIVNSGDPEQSSRLRDVYQDQQLERGERPQEKTPFSRQVICIVVAVALFILTYVLDSLIHCYALAGQAGDLTLASDPRVIAHCMLPTLSKLLFCLFVAGTAGGALYAWLMQNLKAQNALNTYKDINTYHNDQHIALPEETQRFFDWFPDAGAHSTVEPSAMISHMALTNKGVDPVDVVCRHATGTDDSEFFAAIDEDEDELDIQTKPMFDTEFSDALFETSGVNRRYWRRFDPNRIPYNPGNRNRDKLKGYDTVADLVNGDWEIPYYEVARPSGAYVVDTQPANTMVIAITRAGKGQTYIEPMIDMWMRAKHQQNIVVNDPKGELLVKFYVTSVVRGYRPVQFNLINALKTDIENPLALAYQSAQEGDATKVSAYVTNIADVFFPVDGNSTQDPMWNNAAANAFRRAALGLIEYYLEEERETRLMAEREHWATTRLDTTVDRLWGKVTLYNCYQMFVQLTSKKLKNPAVLFNKQAEAGAFNNISDEEYDAKLEMVNKVSKLWSGSDAQGNIDLLTLYFNAVAKLPHNQMRTLVSNADNALRAMGGADKMIASVYAIALTAMSFFSDPTISTLTSGTPSQNVDLGSFSFPRRIGVRLHPDFLTRYHLVGMQARWQAYEDREFTRPMEGREFTHTDTIGRAGWARFYLKGIFPEMSAYLRLDCVNPDTNVVIRTLYFRFDKAYQRSLDGRHYVQDPILEEKIVQGGSVTELVEARQRDGRTRFVEGHLRFPTTSVTTTPDGRVIPQRVHANAVRATAVRYEEKPKILFMVTPPHLMSYAKLVLIILKQLVDLNFDQSYMTRSNQKPDYKTYFMLDELGNLQSEGHGINGLETMLSIGLGQDQRFTLILQTLQQLRMCYGENSDKVIQGNAQPLDARIATPAGWKAMGDMHEGSKVVTPSGRVATVTGVYPRGRRPVYRVTLADGSATTCCNQHLWRVRVHRPQAQ